MQRFTAHVITGAGRGKGLGVPTLNLDLRDVPKELEDGVFACRVFLPSPFPSEARDGGGAGGGGFAATMHNGPRPTFDNSRSCEVHLIDESVPVPPQNVTVDVVEFLRGISKYPTAEALTTQMFEDIRRTKQILS